MTVKKRQVYRGFFLDFLFVDFFQVAEYLLFLLFYGRTIVVYRGFFSANAIWSDKLWDAPKYNHFPFTYKEIGRISLRPNRKHA